MDFFCRYLKTIPVKGTNQITGAQKESPAPVFVSELFGVVLVVDTPLKLLGEPVVRRPPDSAHLKLFKDCSVLMALEATLYESVKLIVIQSQ
jgi:hypothetical protein